MDNNRTLAMTWWNNLSSLQRTQICDTNTDYLGVARRHESLTGREIEELFNRNGNEDHDYGLHGFY